MSRSLSFTVGTRRNSRNGLSQPLYLTDEEILHRLLAQVARHLLEDSHYSILLYKCSRWTQPCPQSALFWSSGHLLGGLPATQHDLGMDA